jgi:hypothetical protein
MTADSNIKNQQNLADRKIAILVVRALENRLSTPLDMLSDIGNSLEAIHSGDISEIFHSKIRKEK